MTNQAVKHEIAALGYQAHQLTESLYQQHAARRGDPDWAEKQRILLADMALHLLQTAMKDEPLSVDELKRNLFAILTVADQFIPGQDLKGVAGRLHAG